MRTPRHRRLEVKESMSVGGLTSDEVDFQLIPRDLAPVPARELKPRSR